MRERSSPRAVDRSTCRLRLVPVVEAWAARSRLSARVLLMPLSFASVLGGTLTLIGNTSTLVLQGLLEESLAKDRAAEEANPSANATDCRAMSWFMMSCSGTRRPPQLRVCQRRDTNLLEL